MPRLARAECRQVKSFLRSAGFVERKGKGSHLSYIHENFNGCFRKVTVDCPKAPFGDDLMKSMAQQAGFRDWKVFWGKCLEH